jgi:hypothetical protein
MKPNRRSFLKQSSLAMASCSFYTNNESPLNVPFAHHGLYWLKDKDNKENYAHMLKRFKELKKIKEVKFLHVGAPLISDIDFEARVTDATYTFSYLVLFDSKKDKENYLKNPLHSHFVNDFKDVVSKVVIYDSLEIAD